MRQVAPFCTTSELVLDLLLPSFERQYFDINELLMKKHFFLRIYELFRKFRYLKKKQVQKNKIIRQLLSCVIEKFSGFQIDKKRCNDKLKNDMFLLTFYISGKKI